MPVKQVKTARHRYLVWLGALIATSYFVYHAINGGHGLLAMGALEAEKMQLTAELAALEMQKHDLEKRVSLLRPESIDPDMLDERARVLLNQAKPNEIVLMMQQQVGQAPDAAAPK